VRVAIVLTTKWWRGSIDHDGYARSLRRIGLSPILVCLGNEAGEADFPIQVVSRDEQEDANFWRQQQIDLAIVWNWLRGSRVLAALRTANVMTIVRGDTDGMISARVFPRESFVRTVANGNGVKSRLGLAKFFLLNALPYAYEEDQKFLRTVELTDAVAVETPVAKQGLTRVLKHYGQPDQVRKVHIVPHSVRDVFSCNTVPLQAIRPRQVLAAGRWDSNQKNPELLLRTIRQLLRLDPDLSIVVCGPLKESLAKVSDSLGERVTFIGRVSTDEMVEQLSISKTFLSTSRWETHPIGALEAICLGCRVVAPPIRGFVDLLSDQRFGSLAKRCTPASLAKTVIDELEKPALVETVGENAIAEFRQSVSNDRVVKDLLDTVYFTASSKLP
jgi:glycosyltransferase involved in cell wall biosynthesis